MRRQDMKTLSDCVKGGDELDVYKRLQLDIALQLEETHSGRDIAALARQFASVTDKITELEKKRGKARGGTALDAARRKRGKQ